jgi:hypothetical protein
MLPFCCQYLSIFAWNPHKHWIFTGHYCPRALPFIPSGANSFILLKIKVIALEQSKAIYAALA